MNVFIDLGSHYGMIIRKFMASPLYSSDFVIYAFEPNPVITQTVFMQYPKCVTIHREAAWICDCEMDFYLNPNPTFQGATLIKEKNTGWLDKDKPYKIRCIDFSAWLAKYIRINDNVIVKCNIEGAEYALFDKLINDGTINLINRIHLRRHWHKCQMPKEVDDSLITRLSEYKNLKVFYDYKFEK